MTPTATTSDVLSQLSDCAYRLGLAFGAEAESTNDLARKMELFQLFERCFFGVRVAVALKLRLGRDQRLRIDALGWRRDDRDDTEAEHSESERPERESPEREPADRTDDALPYTERDRDREGERASLPVLLSALNGVVRDAAALPGPAPAALPALKDLLSRVGVQATPPRRPASQPSPSTGPVPLRARLSAGVALAIPLPPASGAASPLRRATGPPRRR